MLLLLIKKPRQFYKTLAKVIKVKIKNNSIVYIRLVHLKLSSVEKSIESNYEFYYFHKYSYLGMRNPDTK